MNAALEIEVQYLAEMITVLENPAPPGWVILCSGGVAASTDAPPVLCLTREQAIQYWVEAITGLIWQKRVDLGVPAKSNMALRWAEDPGIYRYAITMQHETGHRMAEERFAVVCRVWIGSLAEGESLPPETPAKRESER